MYFQLRFGLAVRRVSLLQRSKLRFEFQLRDLSIFKYLYYKITSGGRIHMENKKKKVINFQY